MTAVLRPIAEPFSPEIEEAFKKYPRRDGYILALFKVFANSVRLLNKGFVNLLDRESPLPVIEREIVILRVCANYQCEYEWGVHVTAFADYANLSSEQVQATLHNNGQLQCWSERQRLLIGCVDELCREGRMVPETLVCFRQTWDLEQQLEILALAGSYQTIAFIANAAELPLENFAARFPQ